MKLPSYHPAPTAPCTWLSFQLGSCRPAAGLLMLPHCFPALTTRLDIRRHRWGSDRSPLLLPPPTATCKARQEQGRKHCVNSLKETNSASYFHCNIPGQKLEALQQPLWSSTILQWLAGCRLLGLAVVRNWHWGLEPRSALAVTILKDLGKQCRPQSPRIAAEIS